MNLVNKKVGAVFHDAGSANLGISYLKQKKINAQYYCKGPALKILNREFDKSIKNTDLNKLIEHSDVVITGTSRKNNIELQTRKIIKNKKKINVTIIDHWTGYLKGFKYGKGSIFPNYLYVFNKKSYELAKKIFPKKIKICKKTNYFEKKIVSNIKKNLRNSNNLLYVLEPFDNHFEFLALKRFKNFLEKSNDIRVNLKFKLHPSEKKEKYSKWLKRNYKIKYELVNDQDIAKSLTWANYVVGLESYMLVLAMKAKKKVFTILPFKKKKFRLPFKKIKNLSKMKIV